MTMSWSLCGLTAAVLTLQLQVVPLGDTSLSMPPSMFAWLGAFKSLDVASAGQD